MSVILSVKPKPKAFCTTEEKKKFVDEYTKKKKTELCKTFTLTGTCKFGNSVFISLFINSVHLHTGKPNSSPRSIFTLIIKLNHVRGSSGIPFALMVLGVNIYTMKSRIWRESLESF